MIDKLTAEYEALGFAPAAAREEAAREIRMTTGDPYAYRTEEELEAMYAEDATAYQALAESAGVCEEFPAGEFAVQGFNVW